MQLSNNIPLLLELLANELHTEVIVNKDTTEFWKKSQIVIFESPIAAFRESLTNLQEKLIESPEMLNYFTSMVMRMVSNPVTVPALDEFSKGFDAVAADAIFGESITIKASQMQRSELLMLFITVHRNAITLAMYKRDADIKMEQRIEYEARLAARTRK